jgi:hypothetical protein
LTLLPVEGMVSHPALRWRVAANRAVTNDSENTAKSCIMAHLTPSEKQDVVRYLEADKPLSDKYRFLLVK